jgi:DNA replication protein DnaC
MAAKTKDIEEMLDYLGLCEMSGKLDQMVRLPDYQGYTPVQFLKELVSTQYLYAKNHNFETRIRFSKIRKQDIQLEKLHTGNGRLYPDGTVDQLQSFEFTNDGLNVAVFGESNAGKSYFLKGFGIEACRRNIRTLFVDYLEMMDDLMEKKVRDNGDYRKRLRFYAKIPLLIIDDFAISRLNDSCISTLFELIKRRDDNSVSTMISTQYSPAEWKEHLCTDQSDFAKTDAIRRRLIDNGYTVIIEKVK